MDTGGGLESPEPGRVSGIAFDLPVTEPSDFTQAKVPRRIRRRLLEAKSSSPSSVEEIEAKLREADLRRQQFHEWLSSKARPKPRSPSWSSQEEDLGQRLEAKLYAAEQKRLSLMTKAQLRLARLDELRQAAKNGVEMRFEKEREELGSKVECRVQQAEANRMRLLKAHRQRRAAVQERTARSSLQRIIRENKYKECIRTAISQKRAAAEKKRMGLLEAEKTRAHARVMQARRIANSVCHQRETERRRMKEQLEDRLQRAKTQRAEYLRQRGSPQSTVRISWNKHGDFLSRKLARCWRRFVRSRKTTFVLAKAYGALEINEKFVRSMPFEQLALRIESAATLQTVKALLERLESRYILSQLSSSSGPENIDHLLKRVASPNRRMTSGKGARARAATKKAPIRESRSSEANKSARYPVRVVLCAYMIVGHPNAVFSEQGEHEIALKKSAANFVREFELLIKIILDGPTSACSSRQSSPDFTSDDLVRHEESSAQLTRQQTFRSQLSAFDMAWRSYLYCFVVWKVKDARLLEEDLVRAACQLELSMMQKCKLTSEGQSCDLSHDMRAIQKQVTEDQQLLREKVQHLSGNAGIERMECALSDTRSRFFQAKESGSSSLTPVARISSPAMPNSSRVSVMEENLIGNDRKSNRVVRSLFRDASSSPPKVDLKTQSADAQLSNTVGKQLPTENELLVNEIVHQSSSNFANKLDVDSMDEIGIKAKVKDTMEKAFWDGIIQSMKEDNPDYSRIVGLVKEVRDELCEMAPQTWKQEILETIDLDILSQVLDSGIQDTDYLGRVLEYALIMLQKLSAPANEDDMKKAHKELLSELAYIAQSDDKVNSSFVIATIKGLRFVLDQIQTLKREISKARIHLMEPIIKGPAGLEYLQNAFSNRYGSASGAANSLPRTAQWISSIRNSLEEEWGEHTDFLSCLPTSQGLPHVTALRTGGSIPQASNQGLLESRPSASASSGGDEQLECNGERVDMLVRLGLLKLTNGIEGLTSETVPETLELNLSRLRSVQSQLQQIIVISTSMLVLRQILLSENSTTRASDLEITISDSFKKLSELLERVPDVGIEEIIETIAADPSSEEKVRTTRKEVMARVLTKSLQADDAVFTKVSRSIYLAARGVVLGGSGARGRKLADAALRRVGATLLMDRVIKAAEVLIVVATVSVRVHGPWYSCLI